MMDYHVMEARYIADYRIWLRFRDGTEGEIDLKDELRGKVFKPLRDLKEFRKFRVHPGCHTLVWPNEADFAPEFLHEQVRMSARSAG